MMNVDALVVVWRVTENCNLGCRFCEYSRHLRRPRTTANPEQVRAFGELLRDYRAVYGREVLVSWLGGEPLLWPPLTRISHTFKHEFNLRVGVTTNGTALESALVRQRIVEDYDQITISIDGIGEFHDWCRDAQGLYDQLRAGILDLRELKVRRGHGPLIRVNTILMRNNLHQFERLCCSLAEWGVEQVSFNALGGKHRPEFYQSHSLLPEHVAWLHQELPDIRERMARLGLSICGGEHYLHRIVSSIRGNSIPVFDCQPGARSLFIDERGVVAPCSFTTQGYGFRLDELKTAGDVDQIPWRLAERKRKEMLAPCFDCRSTQVFGKFSFSSIPLYFQDASYLTFSGASDNTL
jgi:MoaA/NifB/PqqE/SkfB family radical SAM enzyme